MMLYCAYYEYYEGKTLYFLQPPHYSCNRDINTGDECDQTAVSRHAGAGLIRNDKFFKNIQITIVMAMVINYT